MAHVVSQRNACSQACSSPASASRLNAIYLSPAVRRRPSCMRAAVDKDCSHSSAAQQPVHTYNMHTTSDIAARPRISTPQAPSAEVSFATLSTVTLGLAGALALAMPQQCSAQDMQDAHSSLAAIQPQFDLAGGEDLLTNLARYGRYFVTVMLGTGYVMLRPLAGAFKNPVSSVLATVGVIGGVFLLKFTLELMLGVTDAGDLSFEYVQGNF